MCGISGYISSRGNLDKETLDNISKRMTDTLNHRGPDDYGIWSDQSCGISLGQRRLSIIDLSKNGHQPMMSQNNRYIIVLNGEIYNHLELKKYLLDKEYIFRGTSDTEVAINAIQEWGLVEALKRFVGMFALAVWDREDRQLYLARDRIGEKPLYYGNFGNTFAFASELKALTVHPEWQSELDRNAIALQMQYTYIPTPFCIYKGIKKLPPGTYVQITHNSTSIPCEPEAYWSFDEIVLSGSSLRQQDIEKEQVIKDLHNLLLETICDKMIADVPLGAFLSGGIDSTLVVAMMQAQSSRPVKTFSIGFHEDEYNEANYASEVAKHLGTDHTELYVTPQDSLDVIPRIPELYDEPFSDASQIPTYLVSELAKRDVTVALSGDGGDELFGGYGRYLVGLKTWNKIQSIPPLVRHVGGKMIHSMPPRLIDLMVKPVRPIMPRHLRFKQFGEKLHKLANVWNTATPDSIYNSLVSLWGNPQELIPGSSSHDFLGAHRKTLKHIDSFTERMMFTDTLTYLPDDILVKVDRASMAVSLEVRVPFLDHRIVEFIWKQPPELKINGDESKWLLRQILDHYIPRDLIDRPKMGFGVPLDHWLRGPLKEWAGDLISEDRLKRQGLFNPAPVQEKWQAHLSGDISWQYLLWPVLMFQAWHDHWLN